MEKRENPRDKIRKRNRLENFVGLVSKVAEQYREDVDKADYKALLEVIQRIADGARKLP